MPKTKMINSNYNWFLNANLEKYAGEWVVIANKKVVASGRNVKKMFSEAKDKFPDETPLVAKVPKKGVLVL